MRFIEVSAYEDQQFLRLTGVKRRVFERMVEVVWQAHRAFGRPHKLSGEDPVLRCGLSSPLAKATPLGLPARVGAGAPSRSLARGTFIS